MMEVSWSELKTAIDSQDMRVKYIDTGKRYLIQAFDGDFVLETNLLKSASPSDDQTDFENNYKANANKKLVPDTDAYARTDQFAFAGEGFTSSAPRNGSTTNLDYKITAERYINGIQILCSNTGAGDKAAFQIVDKDNIFGAGANYVLQEFATNWQIADSNQDQGILQLPFRGKIPANCYVRIKYTAVNNVLGGNVTVAINLFLHRKTS